MMRNILHNCLRGVLGRCGWLERRYPEDVVCIMARVVDGWWVCLKEGDVFIRNTLIIDVRAQEYV